MYQEVTKYTAKREMKEFNEALHEQMEYLEDVI